MEFIKELILIKILTLLVLKNIQNIFLIFFKIQKKKILKPYFTHKYKIF
jgi:hypothetical protein